MLGEGPIHVAVQRISRRTMSNQKDLRTFLQRFFMGIPPHMAIQLGEGPIHVGVHKCAEEHCPIRAKDIPSEILYGNTTLHGYTAWGRTHTCGSSTNEHIIQDMSTSHQAVSFTSTRHQLPGTWYWSPGSR